MRNEILQRFFGVYLLELRLMCLHWSYLIFLTLWSGFVLVTYTRNEFVSAFGLLNFVLGFSSLIAMFVTGIQASRAQRSRFDMLEVALPTGVEVFLARWFASITAMSALLIAPIIVIILAPPGRIEFSYAVRIVGLTLLSVAFVTGLIWLVQNTVGIRRWMYPFFAVFWVGAGFVPNALQNDGLPFPGTNLTNFITMNESVDSMWGRLPQGQMPIWFIVFYIGIVGVFAGVMMWRIVASRFYRRSPFVMGLTVVALAVMLLGGISYSVEVYAGNQVVLTEDQYISETDSETILTADMPFVVTAYDVTFSNGSPARLTAEIDVRNRSDAPITELLFSLYRQFEVTEASVPFTRDTHTLMLTLPQALLPDESTHVSVNYQGNIWYMDRRLGRPAEATYFTHPNGVNLNCLVLWYPIPGRLLPNYTSYDENFQGHVHCPLDTPAAFRLMVNDPAALTYASNLTRVDATTFESAGTTWAQLIGAPNLETVNEGNLTLITLSNQVDVLLPEAQGYYLPAMQHLQRFFPETQHLTVFVLDLANESFLRQSSFTATTESAIVVIEPQEFEWMESSPQSEYMSVGAPLVTSILGELNYMTAENVAYFLWIHYLTNGDAAEMSALLENGLPTGSIGTYYSMSYAERYPITFALYDVYVAQGEAAIIDLLREMQSQAQAINAMSLSGVITWIEETANAD